MSPLSLRRCVIAVPAPLALSRRAALAGCSVAIRPREQLATHSGARAASAAIGAGDELIGEQ